MGTHIRGILTVVPSQTRTIADLAARFGAADAQRTAQLTGIREARVASQGQTAGDLAFEAGKRLLAKLAIESADVNGLIFVTQTPDFPSPSTACLLQNRLGIAKQSLAFDVNLGCSAYVYGLTIAAGLMSIGAARRILLLVGDTFSQVVHPDDRVCAPLFGDAVVATLLERGDEEDLLGFDLGTDGSGWANLTIPVGQSRYRDAAVFAANPPERLASIAHPECAYMNGTEIFAFTMREVPGIVRRTLESAQRSADSVDYFCFHQANKFIIDHLAKKVGLPAEKCPISLDRFGNTSGASPAVTACDALAAINADRELSTMFLGFGIGYSWSGALVRLRAGTLHAVECVASSP